MIKAYASGGTFTAGGVSYTSNNNRQTPTSRQGRFYQREARRNAGTNRGNTDMARTRRDVASGSYRTATFRPSNASRRG